MTHGLERGAELGRLTGGRCPDPPPEGLTRFEVDVDAPGSARAVLDRAREVLAQVLRSGADRWPDDAGWAAILPRWFVQASAPEDSPETQDVRPGHASDADEEDLPWSVGAFVYWFLPELREWWWWGSEVIDDDRLRICLVVREPSFPHEALDWLLRAAGAERVVDENVRDLMRRNGEVRW